EDGIRDATVTGVQTCALPISRPDDLLLSNQNHPAWCEGLKMAGFVEGPSNFFFVASKALSKLLNEIDPAGTAIHLNRGDGDGPRSEERRVGKEERCRGAPHA